MSSSNNRLFETFVDDVLNIVRREIQYFWNQTILDPINSYSQEYFIKYLENPDIPSELDCPRQDDFNILDTIFKHNQSELVWQLWSKKISFQTISPFDWMYTSATFDFFISELDCYYNPEIYQVIEQVVLASGIIFLFDQYCFVCDRPTTLSLDSEHRLHAEDKPAIQFADGFSIYSSHGVNNGFKIIQSE
ncbi:hypothetical protein NIES2109_49440 [Nostoc sp. HK-01]|nr:hypothetical protein NIES2109_49440 [Nostoc sp. HK-01]